MIKKIKILNKFKTIPENFELELERMTVITGENNSGKTNFIRAVAGLAKVKKELVKVEFSNESGELVIPEIVYIAAENIQPSEDETKFSAKTTGLIKNLSKLFSNLEKKFKLEGHSEVVDDIESLIKKASANLSGFSGNKDHSLEIKLNKEELDSSVIIQALIADITGLESGEVRGIDELGQGTQRIIVASLLKAYVDILIEKNDGTDVPVLIIFEEPEIYLHPRLKRSLNATLEKLAIQKNHQVLIITHDPYFAFKNFDDNEKSIFSFRKEGGITEKSEEGVIGGIEDELLFIYLYSLLGSKENKELLKVDVDGFSKRTYFKNVENSEPKEEKHNDLTYIRHQIHHLGDNPYTIGLVSEKPEDCAGINYYTEKELADAIRKMSEKIGE